MPATTNPSPCGDQDSGFRVNHIPALLWSGPASTRSQDVARHWCQEHVRRDPRESPVERFLVQLPPRPAESPSAAAGLPLIEWSVSRLDPEAVRLARRTLTVVLEMWTSRRPLTHLDRLLDPAPARYVRVVAERLHQQNLRTARLTSIHVCHPHPEAAEVAAVCLIGHRTRALAARFERSRTRPTWRCRAIQLG